jgi:glycosyltransferase involved in cell wall biosynthesis
LPCALLVDAADPERFATAVQRLIDDVELKATLSSRARELSRRYSPEAMVASYVKLIESIAARFTASSQR